MPLANPNVAVAATQMEILTMAKKPTAKKQTKKPTAKKTTTKKQTKKSTARKPSSKHGVAVADPKTQRRPKPRARPATKTKRQRVDGAVAALEDVLHGMGAERAERIRQRVRAILDSFR